MSVLTVSAVDRTNLQAFRLLCQSVLPVYYSPQFYKSVIEGKVKALVGRNGEERPVSFIAWQTQPMGVHILTLGVLVMHRRRGYASILLKMCLDKIIADAPDAAGDVFLYVQLSNEDAVEFYKSHGFVIVKTEENYYKRLSPPDAYLMQLNSSR